MDQRDVEIPSSSLAGPTVGRPSTPQDTTPDPAPSWLISDADRASISGLFSGGIGHWELPWSIPVNAFSSLEIATSQAFPVVNPADMPRGAELCETLDSPKHQGSLTRPAAGVRPSTRVHHNMVPRSPSFLSRGYYSTASDLAGNSLTASRLPDPVSNVQGTSKDPPKSHVCFHFGCSFEGETFKELSAHHSAYHPHGYHSLCCGFREYNLGDDILSNKRTLESHDTGAYGWLRQQQTYACPVDSCPAKNFDSKGKLLGHLNFVHQIKPGAEDSFEPFFHRSGISLDVRANEAGTRHPHYFTAKYTINEKTKIEKKATTEPSIQRYPSGEQRAVDSQGGVQKSQTTSIDTSSNPPLQPHALWSASHEANESSQHIITDPPLKNVPDQGSALYQDLGNYFRWLQENGNIITDIAIIGRARSLIRTDQDARTVEALSSLDGLETFARWHNLSVRQMAYQPPEPQPTLDSTLIEPPALHDLVDKAPRAAPLRAEEWDGSRFASDERNHSQVGGFSSSVRDAPFTDSGYASVPNPSFPPEGEVSKSVPLTGTADDDSKTVYSVATAAVPSLAHKSILEVCKDIHTKIIRQMVNVDWASVSHTIPTLIKAFAVKLGSDTSSDNDRRIMHFVHQHHQQIYDQLKILFGKNDEDECEDEGGKAKRSSGAMSLEDKMSLWGKLSDETPRITNEDELFQGIEEVEEEEGEDEEESTANPIMLQWSQTILSSQAYDWLIASLLKQSSYQWDTSYPQTMLDHIQKPVLQRLPKGTISRKKSPDEHRVAFWLPWHPIQLRVEEEATKQKFSAISNFVALIGSSVDQIQAITIKRYLEQTWVSGGVEILDAIQQVVDQRGSPWSFAAGERRIEASIMDFALIVSVNGPAHFVAECGQQLAWLGASLQPSQQGHFSCTTPGLVSISPQPLTCIANSMTKQFHTSPEDARRLETAHNNHNGEYPNHNWAITFESDQREALIPNRFFQNLMPCFTTRGYPTLRRPSSCAGLEVSEDLISTLLESESVHIDRVQGYLSISTFSHEFQLARTEDSIIVWHPTRSPDHVCTCGFHQTPWKDSQPFIDINEANLLRYRHVFEYCPRSRTLSESEDFVRGVSCPDTPEGARIELTEDAELSSSTHTSSRYTSIDSDMLSISDMSDELSSKPRDPGDPLTQLLETAAHRLLAEFRNEEGSGPNPFASPSSAWADCFAAATDEDESGNSEGQSGTQPGRPLKSRRAGSTSRGTIQPSRKRGRPDDEEEENNNGQPPRKKSPNKKGLQYGEKLLACPFWKLDPVKHRKCFTRAQVDTSYIKQHLRAHHYIEFYCQRCFCTFESQKMRESHSMNVQCIPKDPKYLEGVRLSHEQSHKLRQKLKGKLPEEKWFALWVVLFPSHRRPPSPFVANGLSEDLCDFLGFGTSHGTKILNETLQSSGYLQPRLNESLLLELLRGVQNRLYDEWLASRISSAQVDGGVSDEVSTSSFADSGLPTQIHPTPFGALPPAISLSPFTDSTRSYPMPSNATAPPISTSAFEGSGLPPSDTILPPQHLGAVSAPGTFQPDESSHWQGFNCDYTTEDFTYHAAFNDISDNPLNLDDFDEWLSKTQEGHSNVHTQV